MNLYEPATGVARYPDTGEPVEALPANRSDTGYYKLAHAHVGARHFTPERTLCICADQSMVEGHWKAMTLNNVQLISTTHDGEQTWPDRENVEPYDLGWAGLGFSTVGSRALIVGHAGRQQQYGDAQGYRPCVGCGTRACNCPINIVGLAQQWED
jgi:hypothetical protein